MDEPTANLDEHDPGDDALRRSEARLAAILAASLDCIVGMDHRGLVTEWNPAAAATFGYARDEAIGREMAELIIPPALRPMHRAGLAKYLATGEGSVIGRRIEITAVRRDGTELAVELAITRMPTPGPPSFTGHLRDISEARRAREQRQSLLEAERAARAESDRAGRMKDEFLATLSHELRTPLSAILGWSQILRRGPQSPQRLAEGLATIERNARAQAQIIEDLLDMSRIVSGKITVDARPTELAATVRAAIETVRAAAAAKQIEVVLDEPPEATAGPPVLGDAHRLQQVFWNLLSNAIKFTPAGGAVAVSVAPRDGAWHVAVTDTGEGIDAAFLPHAFGRFRQADASTTRRHGGLGLGLSIVKQLVELHGGEARAESAGVGHGSTFTVTLPFATDAPASPAPRRADPGDAAAATADATRVADVRGMRVLVVDDEPDARAMLGRMLDDRGARPLLAATAEEALATIRRERPDVLVSDIGMPDVDGYGLLRLVRALPPDGGGSIPAVALTAYARHEDRASALAAGYQEHVAKPIDAATLMAVIAGLRRVE